MAGPVGRHEVGMRAQRHHLRLQIVALSLHDPDPRSLFRDHGKTSRAILFRQNV